MHHESLIEVLEKSLGLERVACILSCALQKLYKIVNCNSRLDEKGVVQSKNLGCPLEWSRLGEKRVAQSENLGFLLEWSRPEDPISPERKLRVLSGVVSPGRPELA